MATRQMKLYGDKIYGAINGRRLYVLVDRGD